MRKGPEPKRDPGSEEGIPAYEQKWNETHKLKSETIQSLLSAPESLVPIQIDIFLRIWNRKDTGTIKMRS